MQQFEESIGVLENAKDEFAVRRDEATRYNDKARAQYYRCDRRAGHRANNTVR